VVERLITSDIETEGLRALRDRLGPAGMLRFLRAIGATRGDYTAERELTGSDPTLDSLEAALDADSAEPTSSDWMSALAQEARRVATLGADAQEAWLAQLSKALPRSPALPGWLDDVRRFMRSAATTDVGGPRSSDVAE